MTPFFIVVSLSLALLLVALWRRQVALRRENYIRSFVLPHGLFDQLRKTYPQLSLKDCQLVAHGLRQFFLAYLKSGRQYVSMPSQVADALWHEFILFTKNYDAFCRRAFGKFLHHTPAAALSDARQSNAGLRRCWWYSCAEDNISPRHPTRLPLLFALDTKLEIPGGFRYAADCRGYRTVALATGIVHCGGDFSSTAFDGGTEGFGDSGSDGSGDGDGGGGGCGGE